MLSVRMLLRSPTRDQLRAFYHLDAEQLEARMAVGRAAEFRRLDASDRWLSESCPRVVGACPCAEWRAVWQMQSRLVVTKMKPTYPCVACTFGACDS